MTSMITNAADSIFLSATLTMEIKLGCISQDLQLPLVRD